MIKISYDAHTENGIDYVSRIYATNFKYKNIVNNLDGLVNVISAYSQGKGSVTSYSLGTRSTSRQVASLQEAREWWDDLIRQKEKIECGKKPRKAVGAVPMDW